MTAPVQESDDGLPKEGDVIAGKYRVDRTLGQGGMGVVVAATHTTLRQTVAVKLLLPEAMQRHDSVERFLREGRAAVSIQSEHIARVLDVGTLESGQPFMVMEYLVGNDLGVMLKERGPLPITEAVDYVLQACEAIAEAHSLGIVHRDLKPANIFCTRRADGSALVKVLDFGLSKVNKHDSLEPSLTSANTVMGSPYYMSPEQVRSMKHIDARADIWALGVILYQLISGHRPFEEESLGALFVMIGAEPAAPIRQWLPAIHPELEAILYKCLEKAPNNRFQTVAELARALAPFASDGARISIERILRVLADHAPLAMRTAVDSVPANSTLGASDRASASYAPNPNNVERASGPSTPLVPPGSSLGGPAPPTLPQAQPGWMAPASNPPAPPMDPNAKPPSVESMPAMSSSLAGPSIEAAAQTGRHGQKARSRAIVYVIAAGLALAAGATTVLVMMSGPGATAAASGEPQPATTEATANTGPSVVPAPVTATATATEAPGATTATTATATTTATAAPATTSSGTKSKFTPRPRRTADPLDRR